MTKNELIIKAWLDLKIKTPFGICDNTGYLISYCVNGIDDVLSEFPTIKDKIEFYYCSDDILKWRPKTIHNIENNNGWMKIERESDLPNVKDELIIFRNKEGFTTTWQGDDITSTPIYFLRYSHWRIKEKLLEPIY
jgi:hypothetical protein